MKKIIATAQLALLLLMAGCATAQNYPERTIDGKDYYIYSVEPGNTLYAISRQFAVDVDDLVKANPTSKEGLSIGQQILVPIDAVDRKKAKNSEVQIDGSFILHTVQRKETLFSISREYGVDLDELMVLNKEANTSLGTGDVIKIPSSKSNFTKEIFLEPAENDTFMVHQVQESETAYSLAKEYGISLDSLNNANGGFPRGLAVGQWIVIPKYKQSYQEIVDANKPEVQVSDKMYPSERKDVYKLGLLLPFELSQNDSLLRSLEERKDLFVLTEIALEYYRGSMMALDSLKKMGLNAEVYVYDVGDNVVDARNVVTRPEMRDMDMVFGPMHKSSLAVVSDVSKESGMYVVSPNSFTNEIFEDNAYLLRASASRETLMRYLANFVAIQHQNHNVLLVNSGSPKDWPYRKLFIKSYNEALGSFSNVYSDSIRSVTKGNLRPEEITSWLRKDTLNILVVPSAELAFVSDFMTKLSRIDGRSYKVQVYGLDDWLRYDNIDAEYKNRFKLRLVAPNYVDYKNKQVISFLKAFRERYEMEPSQYGYGFLGYDLTMYFGKALLQQGLGFPNSFGKLEMPGVSANYRFGKSTTGKEFENKSVYIIEYDDYQIKRIN